ncbi:EutP/PduV family microcompartment system protein [Desulfopila sp. IMCC35008]|uniref:EutP/PduV family microcompartment system protein n=1 Tax=Desulfopila sp. IMCC35008 TaxID=2653858 RepID=UPI0013CFAEA6|nr:EutP/PduV family microcompartment system protein [Desulfopila sp. IMCC35008]
MKKMMLIGESLVGKSTLIRELSGDTAYTSHRAMAVEYCGQFINTPGEFLENRRFYNALITSSADCDILALVQDATRKSSLFPPLFASMFNRRVIGIISKVDAPGANTQRAQIFLQHAGIKETVLTSCKTKEGFNTLQQMLV